MKNAYLRFLAIADALTTDSDGALAIDEEAKRLLEVIAVREMNGTRLTVTEAMELGKIASPATIHRKIDILLNAGLIDFAFEGTNRRTKFLVATPKAKQHFESLGKVMQKVMALPAH